MSPKNNTTLKLANSLYDSKSLARAVEEFSSSVDIALTKKGNYTEVAISNEADVNALFEFANYALFLTIQAR
jgi:hypothetical protein